MSRLRPIAAAIAALVLVPVAADAAKTRQVVIEDVDFAPATARIDRGERVRWVWRDGATPHNVRSRGKRRFKGSSTKTDGTHTVRFSRAGTYRYVCTVHFNMRAKVVVR